MGTQIGPIHLSGKIGGIQFYIDADGNPRFKKAAPPRKEKMRRDANYAQTRKGNAEFKGASVGVHSVRLCFGERIRWFADRHLSSRLNGLCRSMISRGPGYLGQRTLEVASNAAHLRSIELSKVTTLQSRFQAPIAVTVNPDRNTATLDVPPFNVDASLTRPQGATHFKLYLVVGVLSDLEFVGGEQVYAPVDADLNGVSKTEVSTALPAVNSVTSALQIVATIPGLPVLPSTSCLVVSLGIEYLQIVNTYEEVMAQGNAMRVVGVY